jgi:anti-sigma regulatory factor (Ser/Thr protein kinase)
MQLQLIFTNDNCCLASVAAFTRETLRQWPFDDEISAKLAECVLAAAQRAIEHAYPAGEEGRIELTIREEHGKLEILIRDWGLPADSAALEQRLHNPAQPGGSHALDWPGLDAIDEIHSIGYGREGKAIQIIKWIHDDHIAESADAATLAPFHEDVPLAPPQEYLIQRMTAEQAVQVSQLMYRAYGATYFNEDVYYPDRVSAQNDAGTVISFVAVGADGQVAGHYALERNQAGPVAEGGQAVVDPAHRGRGLLDRMKEAALAEAQRLNLAGWYADAVAVHVMTQQSNLKHGGRLVCADLAIAPSSEQFRNIDVDLTQRVSCMLFFHWIASPRPRTLFVPERHRQIIAEIYANLECPIEFGDMNTPPVAPPHGELRVSIDTGAEHATIRAVQLGGDSLHLIRHAKREIVERSHAEVVYAELPIADRTTAVIAEALAAEGFGFLGIAPCFAGDGGDLLRLAYLVEPLERAAIKTTGDFTNRLVDYALADQQRVQSTL